MVADYYTRMLLQHFPNPISVKVGAVGRGAILPLFMYDSSDYDGAVKVPANPLFSYDTCDMSPDDFLALCEGQVRKKETWRTTNLAERG